MQLIWVSGPTARVVTVCITRSKILIAFGLAVCSLLLAGGAFHLIGLRVAIEHVPSLAHKLGGVASLQQQQRMEASYQQQLEKLHQQLAQTTDQLHQLESSRRSFFERIGLGALTQSMESTSPKAGRGGPYKTPMLWQASEETLSGQMIMASYRLDKIQHIVEQTQHQWQRQKARLQTLPLALPLETQYQISSHFGLRSDPLTHLPAMHEGLDFLAPVGTPILVTADGQVVQARYNGAYGNMVEVVHAEGFATRYAHLQTILVHVGQRLNAGDRVGLLGNTGRSTGPHLHYEVLYKGQAMHPIKAVQAWSHSSIAP